MLGADIVKERNSKNQRQSRQGVSCLISSLPTHRYQNEITVQQSTRTEQTLRVALCYRTYRGIEASRHRHVEPEETSRHLAEAQLTSHYNHRSGSHSVCGRAVAVYPLFTTLYSVEFSKSHSELIIICSDQCDHLTRYPLPG